jgi:hypothetical protein
MKGSIGIQNRLQVPVSQLASDQVMDGVVAGATELEQSLDEIRVEAKPLAS